MSATMPSDYGFLSTGCLSVFTNLVVLAILFSDRRLFRRSAFIFCLTVGHVIGGSHLIASSSYRLLYGPKLLITPAVPWDCVRLVWSIFYTYESQSVGILMALIGVERLCAVRFAIWYRTHWTRSTTWLLGLGVFPCVAIVAIWGFYWAWTWPAKVTLACYQNYVWGAAYVSYSAAVSYVGGTLSIVCTLVAYVHQWKKLGKVTPSSQSAGLVQKQLRLTRTMLSISIIDFVLTVIPNLLLVCGQMGAFSIVFSAYLTIYAAISYSINAEANLIAYLMFNVEFRKAAKNIVSRLRKGQTTTVVAVSTTVNVRSRE